MAESSIWIDVWTLKFVADMLGIIVANDEAELQVKVHLMMDCFNGLGTHNLYFWLKSNFFLPPNFCIIFCLKLVWYGPGKNQK